MRKEWIGVTVATAVLALNGCDGKKGDERTTMLAAANTDVAALKAAAASRPAVGAKELPAALRAIADAADRSGDMTGKLIVAITSPDGSSVSCAFDAAAGMGTIPTADLMMLGAGMDGSFGVFGTNAKDVTAGAYAVVLQLAHGGPATLK